MLALLAVSGLVGGCATTCYTAAGRLCAAPHLPGQAVGFQTAFFGFAICKGRAFCHMDWSAGLAQQHIQGAVEQDGHGRLLMAAQYVLLSVRQGSRRLLSPVLTGQPRPAIPVQAHEGDRVAQGAAALPGCCPPSCPPDAQ